MINYPKQFLDGFHRLDWPIFICANQGCLSPQIQSRTYVNTAKLPSEKTALNNRNRKNTCGRGYIATIPF